MPMPNFKGKTQNGHIHSQMRLVCWNLQEQTTFHVKNAFQLSNFLFFCSSTSVVPEGLDTTLIFIVKCVCCAEPIGHDIDFQGQKPSKLSSLPFATFLPVSCP